MTLLGKGPRWRKALAMFDRLVETGPQPNAFIATTAISIAGRNNQARRDCAQVVRPGGVCRGAPCVVTLFSEGKCSLHLPPLQEKRAEQIFSWLQTRDPPSPPTHKTYTALIQACGRVGNWRCAQQGPDRQVSRSKIAQPLFATRHSSARCAEGHAV